jgi:hypothetical protein
VQPVVGVVRHTGHVLRIAVTERLIPLIDLGHQWELVTMVLDAVRTGTDVDPLADEVPVSVARVTRSTLLCFTCLVPDDRPLFSVLRKHAA